MNGGIILGSADGTNLEIAKKVGEENIFMFDDSHVLCPSLSIRAYEIVKWFQTELNFIAKLPIGIDLYLDTLDKAKKIYTSD